MTRFLDLSALIASATVFWMASALSASADVIKILESEVVAQSTKADPGILLSAASDAFKAGDDDKFKSIYKAALQKFKDLPPAEIFKAKLQIESGQFKQAIADMDRFLLASPDHPEAYLALGEIALRTQRLSDAVLLLDRAQSLCDDDKIADARKTSVEPAILNLRAEVAERQGSWEKAVQIYQQLADSHNQRPDFIWKRGRVQVLKGDVEGGVATMTEASGVNKDLPSPELAAALILSSKNELDEAEKWFEKATSGDPGNVLKWSEYLKWMLSNERPEKARTVIDALASDLRSLRPILLFDGLTARYLGDLEKAEDIFSSLHQSNPADLEAADQLAAVLVESKDESKRSRALQISEANLRQAPSIENIVATAGWVQFRLGSIDVADRLLGELASKVSISPQTGYYVAQVMEAKGNFLDARRILEASVKSPGIFVERAKVKGEFGLEDSASTKAKVSDEVETPAPSNVAPSNVAPSNATPSSATPGPVVIPTETESVPVEIIPVQ